MKNKAMLVGVSEGPMALAGAVPTIGYIESFLKSTQAFDIATPLVGWPATTDAIEEQLEWLLTPSPGPEQALVLAVSAHGAEAFNRARGRIDGSFFPSDYDPRQPENRIWLSDLESRFRQRLASAKGRLYCVFDFCQTPGAFALARRRYGLKGNLLLSDPPPEFLGKVIAPVAERPWIVLSACQPGTPAHYDSGNGLGWFTAALMQASAGSPSTENAMLDAFRIIWENYGLNVPPPPAPPLPSATFQIPLATGSRVLLDRPIFT